MDNENINFDQEAEEYTNDIIDEAAIEFSEIELQQWFKLWQAADYFVNEYDKIYAVYKKERNQYFNSIKNVNDAQKQQISAKFNNKRLLFIQQKYSLAFQFDKQLNDYKNNGHIKQAVFVYSAPGSAPVSYVLPMEEFVKIFDRYGRIYQTQQNLAFLQMEAKQTLEQEVLGQYGQIHIDTVQAAYSGTLNRMERYYDTHSNLKQRQKALIMWREGRFWMVARVHNSGDVKEAYVAALMAKHADKMGRIIDVLCNIKNLGVQPYQSDDLVSTFFDNYISKVSNMPAIIEEDVVTDNAEYAVKGDRASAPQFKQYYETARAISGMRDSPIKAQDVNNWLKTQNNFKNESFRNIKKKLSEITDKQMEKVKQDMKNSVPPKINWSIGVH